MSEQSTLELPEVDQSSSTNGSTAKRKTLSLGDRLRVIDYLRGLVEPIVADSNVAAAAIVSAAVKFEINWPQLKYMIDDVTLEEWKLVSKVHIRSSESLSPIQDAIDRIVSLEKRVDELERAVVVVG